MADAIQARAEMSMGRWLTVLWGLVPLVVGVLLVTRPSPTALFLASVMALLWVGGGIIDIASVMLRRTGRHGRWRLVGGVVAIVAGVIILLGDPFTGTALVVLVQFYLIALAAIVNGLINIVGRFQGLSGWGRLVLGIVQLAIGVFFLFNTGGPGLLTFVPALGIVMAIGGAIIIALAVPWRNLL